MGCTNHQYGEIDHLSNEKTYSTLFVCTANQCRSPMAEALFRMYITNAGYSSEEWIVESAGCWAYPGMPATKKAVIAAEKLGAELYFHESKPVTESLLRDFRLILCMERNHVEFIKRHIPEAGERVFLFTEMVNENEEINDPIGQKQDDYNLTAENLLEQIGVGFNKIKKLSAL